MALGGSGGEGAYGTGFGGVWRVLWLGRQQSVVRKPERLLGVDKGTRFLYAAVVETHPWIGFVACLKAQAPEM